MQPVDFTTLMAICHELRQTWIPARLEQVYQRDRHTLCLALRTLQGRSWLTISWNPQAARLHISDPPPRQPDTFTFSQQLWHQLGGLALVDIAIVAPFERVIALQFAKRPGDPILWQVYVEIMGQYSNVILVNQAQEIVTAAYQVGNRQSRIRSIQTGDPYELPPRPTSDSPTLEEPRDRWQDRLQLIPGPLGKTLLKTYRGLSSTLVAELLSRADLDATVPTDRLQPTDWQRLFDAWQTWLKTLAEGNFHPCLRPSGYSVLGWNKPDFFPSAAPNLSAQEILNRYYTDRWNEQIFSQLKHQLQQRLANLLGKLHSKRSGFLDRLQASDRADELRQQADLLMAHLHLGEPGMDQIELSDFATGEPIKISLSPEKNLVQNAQSLYKQYQKLTRARAAIDPLLATVQGEIHYLEQVETALRQLETYTTIADLDTLEEIREELIQQGYLEDPNYRREAQGSDRASEPHHYPTPSGFELLIGRNNRQNDQLTFRTAGDYDLWFHTQEIPGSHVLLRMPPGSVPDEADLQFAADLTAYYSQARQSEQVPVIYTQPKHVYKPKGAKPGTVIYKQEQILWGNPQRGLSWLREEKKV
ncbi:Rqc2 family fibronectin-binding protein [Alkalinema pantanalense CENA528]|uniref:Rqc2 family fibronectin-binding protein n=1 Tax=Alkalinema pantanalense TaxID=1620705 RepID=UPI003D6F9C86